MKILNLDSIKASANIIQVVQSYLPMQKVGSNYKACCPFHNEQTPSFVINETKQIFHCFGCGVSGDVFAFVQKYKKIDFREAVEMVANALNIAIEYDKTQNPSPKSKYKELLEVNELINEICKETLINDNSEMVAKCREYLKKRGLNSDDFSRYDIGFVPKMEVFFNRLNSLQRDLALELGFIRKHKDKEGYYVLMSERISFALHNHTHKVAGFSARAHPYKNFRNAGKYINSSESEIFKKSQILYRYTLAKSVIYSTKQVYIVEGFMDAIALDKLGIKNAVATCGTAFGLAHLSALLSISQEIEIIFCFDKDEAGGSAALRSLELCYKARFYNAKIAWATNAVKDFGEVLEKGEKLELKKLKGFDFFLRYKNKKAKNNAQKQAVLEQARKIIDSCELYYEKCDLIEQAQHALKIPLQYLQNPQNQATQKAAQMPSIEMVLLKSAIFDEKMAFILREVVASEGSEILGRAKNLYEIWASEGYTSQPQSKELNAIACDERVKIIIDNRAFAENLKALQIQNLKNQILLAKECKNIDLLLALQDKLQKLTMPF